MAKCNPLDYSMDDSHSGEFWPDVQLTKQDEAPNHNRTAKVSPEGQSIQHNLQWRD